MFSRLSSLCNAQETLPMRDFDSLSQKEILALAVSLEDEDERIYSDFSEAYVKTFRTGKCLKRCQEEIGHRRRLIDLYKQNSPNTYRSSAARMCADLCTQADLAEYAATSAADPGQVSTWKWKLAASRAAAARTQDAASVSCLTTWRRKRLLTSSALRSWRKQSSNRRSARRRQSEARLFVLQIVHQASQLDGWFGSTLAPVFAQRCHEDTWTHLPSVWPRRWSRHQHGFCRSVVRRRQPDRTGTPWIRADRDP